MFIDYCNVLVPSVAHNTTGTSWSSGTEAGTSIPLSKFFVANPSTPVIAIDLALALGKNLVLTPGVYNLDAPILVTRPDTVILGQGFATWSRSTVTPRSSSPRTWA